MAGTGAHGEDQNQLVSTFCLGDALYGIDTMKVVVRVGDIIRVHHAKDYILGIINLRVISPASPVKCVCRKVAIYSSNRSVSISPRASPRYRTPAATSSSARPNP